MLIDVELALILTDKTVGINGRTFEEVESQIAESASRFTAIAVCPLNSKVKLGAFLVIAGTVVISSELRVRCQRNVHIDH